MSGIMTPSLWQKYITAVNAYSDSVALETVVWHRLNANVDRWGEGDTQTHVDINLQALVAYNVFRTWPVDKKTETGTLDKEYCHIYLNNAYLTAEGYMTTNGLFAFDPALDRFTINGLKYKPSGDTHTAQAGVNPLFQIVILEREETPTSQDARP